MGAEDFPSAMNSSCLRAPGRALEAYGKLPKTPCSPNASYFASAALPVVSKRLFCQAVQPTGSSILLDLAIEAGGLEFLKPSAKPGKVVRRKLRYSFFNLFDCHEEQIACLRGCVTARS